jgi:signal transduction histidine kinase
MGLIILSYLGAFLRLALYLGQPFPNVALFWRKEIKMYTIGSTPSHWPGIAAGLQINDRILCIDGFHPKPSAPVYAPDPRYSSLSCPNGGREFYIIFQHAYDAGAQEISFDIDRSGVLFPVEHVPLSLFTMQHSFDLLLLPVLLSAGYLAISAIILGANPSVETNIVFAQWGVIIAAFLAMEAYSAVIGATLKSTTWLVIPLMVLWFPFLGVSLFHQAGLWSTRVRFRAFVGKTLPFYYGLSALTAALGVVTYWNSDTPIGLALAWPYLSFVAVSASIALFCGVIVLAWEVIKSRSTRDRWQSSLLLVGMAVTIPTIMLPRVLIFFTDAGFPLHLYGWSYASLLAVTLVAYAVLRFQTIPVRTRAMESLALFTFCILTAMILSIILRNETLFPVLLLAALLVGFGLQWGSRLPFLTRVLRREQSDYAALVALERQITALQPTEQLIKACNAILQRYLDVSTFTVWLAANGDTPLTRWQGDGSSAEQLLPAADLAQISKQEQVTADTHSDAALYRGLLAGQTPPPTIAVWAPMTDHGEFVGVLGLGERWTGAAYDQRDLELIGGLSRQVALALANTSQLEQLADASRQVVAAQERERLKIAREIHDTILQFLLVLTYGLDDIRDHHPDVAVEMERWQERISQEASRLRSLLAHLRAPELLVQHGLIGALHGWLGQTRAMTEMRIEADLDGTVEALLAPELKVAIYRCCREAVNNALKHSAGQVVRVILGRADGQVFFSVADDGRGFDVDAATAARDKGYSSLDDMRRQMESVGGRLTVTSSVGSGTIVKGVMSIADEREAEQPT